jgi:D-lactate dehydrogenase (cytochrome)
LGIITQLTMRLFGQPEAIHAATCAFNTVDDAVATVILAIQSGIPLARVELLDEMQMHGMNLYNTQMNFPEKPHLFLEFHGTDAGTIEQVGVFKAICDDYGAPAFQWAEKVEDRMALWQARHDAYYAAKALRPSSEGFVTDCCVLISKLAECITRTKVQIARSGLIAPLLSHVGNGNFHLVILIEPGDTTDFEAANQLSDTINLLALEMGGTVTGEHGVGLGKIKYMQAEHSGAYGLMGQIKQSFDPQNLMNPGKLVDLS